MRRLRAAAAALLAALGALACGVEEAGTVLPTRHDGGARGATIMRLRWPTHVALHMYPILVVVVVVVVGVSGTYVVCKWW